VVDEWLHIHFFDKGDAAKALEVGMRLRYSWLKVVEQQIRVNLSKLEMERSK
jgi:hypothetical protein